MILFIQTENGHPVNHPALEDNLIQAFGAVPDHWERFVRVERPNPGLYEILESDQPAYQKVDGVWTDVWSLRSMTETEIVAKQQAVKNAWTTRRQAENWSAWVFNEPTCSYVPPIPRPDPVDGVVFFWCGAEDDWKVTPAYPNDGRQYQFDFFGWQWEEVPNV
jgi:hypothetical protein